MTTAHRTPASTPSGRGGAPDGRSSRAGARTVRSAASRSDWSAARLPPAALHRAAARVAILATSWDEPALARDLIRQGLADRELLDQPFLPAAEPVTGDRPGLRDRLSRHPRADRTDLDRVVDDLVHLAAGLDGATAAGLDVLIERATDPFGALVTIPAEALFDPAEVAAIAVLPRSTEPAGRPGASTGGRYDAYAMAIMKVTRLCNLRCRYCHDWREGRGNTMSAETMARTFHGFLTDTVTAHLDVTLHGGEPTMIGRRGLLRLLWLQAHFLRPGQTIRTSFQTNGFRVDDGVLALAVRYGMRLGVSLDLDRERHDRNRPDVRGAPSFDRALDTAHRAQRAGVLAGVIVVVDEELIDRGAAALYQELVELGVDAVSVLVERPDNDPASGDRLLPRQRWGRFLLDLDAERRRRSGAGEPPLRIRELESLLTAVRGGEPDYCEHRGNCVGAFYVVEVDGTIGHCDRFVDVEAFSGLGMAGDQPSRIREGLQVKLLSRAEAEARRGRAACRWSSLCRGWCPHERFLAEQYGATRPDGCCGLDELLAGLTERERT